MCLILYQVLVRAAHIKFLKDIYAGKLIVNYTGSLPSYFIGKE